MLNVIVVCGGKGTRIAGVLGSTPKVLAPIGGNTILDYILRWISCSLRDIDHQVNLLTGVGHKRVKEYVSNKSISVRLVEETELLGTLGAIFNALDSLVDGPVLVVNGDTVVDTDLSKPLKKFISNQTKNLLLVKASVPNSRYGGFSRVCNVLRSARTTPEFVSMGVFFTNVGRLRDVQIQNKSDHSQLMIDRDFLDVSPTAPYVLDSGTCFIDIGIPEDYKRAQIVIPQFITL